MSLLRKISPSPAKQAAFRKAGFHCRGTSGVYNYFHSERKERMRKLAMILTLLIPTQLWADDFDFYVLSLSWSASFCDIEGDVKQSDQCDVEHDFKWILHGLWPQYHQGWPAYCNTS
jgi:ribonuclease I